MRRLLSVAFVAASLLAGITNAADSTPNTLTDAEKAAGKVMQICVSRSKSPRLVLDL